jgi:two-component system response regulator QseB
MNLLLLATDAGLATTVRSWMGMNGTAVDWVVNGAEAERCLRESCYDAMLLELGLPDMSATNTVRRIRGLGHELPLVILAGVDDGQERIRLLDLGADDYLVRPVHVDELAARLRVLLRRGVTPYSVRAELRHGALRLVTDSRSASKDGSHVALTEKEYSLLEALLRSKGQVVSRQRLEEVMNGRLCELASNPVEVHVHHLRRKLGAGLITTVRGVGYTLGHEA